MARVKGAMMTRKRRKKVLKLAKGYYGSKSKLFKTAKEAVMKVLGAGIDKIPVRSIEVLHEDSGRPFVVLDGEAKKLFKKLKLKQIDISISHTSTLATAFAIGA